MLTGPNVILTLKIAVIAVTVLLIASLLALFCGRQRLHGQLNLAFMLLTLGAVLGLELLIRWYDPLMFSYFDAATHRVMTIHLGFSVPSAILLPVMYLTGRKGHERLHVYLATLFAVCWTGTFVTGVLFLPHTAP